MSKTVKAIWHDYKGVLSDAFLNILEREGVKLILKKLAWASTGFKGWLVQFVVEELVEKSDEYILEPAFRKFGYVLEVHHNKKIYKKVISAKDYDDWLDATRDI
jgi:hypothetical protein